MKKVDSESVPYLMERGEKPFKPEMYEFIRSTAKYKRAVRHIRWEKEKRFRKSERYLVKAFKEWERTGGDV